MYIKNLCKSLQSIKNEIWIERLSRILDYSIWTFHKQYDKEEEYICLVEDLKDYLNWKLEQIDKDVEEEREDKEKQRAKRMSKEKDCDDLKNILKRLLNE